MVGRVDIGGWLVAWSLALGLAPTLGARDLPGRGRPIEFSEPRSSITATNLGGQSVGKPSLRNLDDEFKKPFEFFRFGESPATRLSTPPPPARILPAPPSSRSLRELMRKRDQWLDLEMQEEEGMGLTPEEMLRVPKYGPDGEPLKRSTQIERYYENLDRARAAAQAAVTNRAAQNAMHTPFLGEETDFKPLNLKLFEEPVNPFAQGSGDGKTLSPPKGELPGFSDLIAPRESVRDFSEVFGFGSSSTPWGSLQNADALQTRKRSIEDLLSLRFLNDPAAAQNTAPAPGGIPAPLSFNPPGGGATAPGFGSISGLGGSPAATGAGYNPAMPMGSGVPSLAGPPTLLGAPQPAWGTPPPVETPRPKLAPTPFQIPQRKF